MSVTVAQIRSGIATNLATVTDVQVLAYVLSNPTPPAFAVFPAACDYNQAMARGLDRWTFTVQAIVSAASDQDGQKQLDTYLAPTGSTSVRAAIESDRTLGGVVDNLVVTRVSGYQLYADERGANLGAEWSVEVWASGQ